MLRCLFAPTLALLAGVMVLAAVAEPVHAGEPARADELGIVVERTTPTHKSVAVVLRSDRQGRIDVRVFRIGAPEALLKAGVDLRSGRGLAFLGSGRSADAARTKSARLRRLHAAAKPERLEDRRVAYAKAGASQLEQIRLPRAGLYLIEARKRDIVARATAVVSDLGIVTKRGPQTTLVWAVNRRTGAPWPETRVRTGAALTDAGTTGADGLLRLQDVKTPTLQLTASAGEHMALGEETWFRPIAEDRRVYAFAHQPAYKPGERIEVYGIVRAYTQSGYALDSDVKSVRVRLIDSRGSVVNEQTAAVTSDIGTFRSGYTLEKTAPTGDWRIVVLIGTDEYEAPLRVAAYRKPAFEVTVTPSSPRVLAGERIGYRVRAAFYDGGIVAGARVTWQLVYNRVDRELFPTEELVKVFFGTEREAYAPVTLQTGKGELNAEGKLNIPVTSPADAQDGYLTMRVTVHGPDRMSVAAGGGASIAASPVRVDLKTDKHLYGPEDEALVTIKVESAAGKSAAGRKGVFTLAHLPEGPTPRHTEAWTKPRPFTTDEHGEARIRVSLPIEGRFRFMAAVPRTAEEPAGSPAEAHLHAWVLGDKPTLGENPGRTLDVVADRDQYAVGDTARILVRSPGAGRSVLAAVEGAQILRSEVLGDTTVWTVAIEEAHAPNVFATFATIYRGELLLETRMLRIPPVQRLLTARIQPDHGELLPGTSSGATITIIDHEGKPVPNAAVSLAVVDEALHALYADPAAPIEPFFHSVRRNNVRTTAMLHHDSVDFVRQAVVAKPKADAAAPPGGASCGSAAPATSDAPTSPAAPLEDPAAEPEASPVIRDEEIDDHEEVDAEEGVDGAMPARGGGGRMRRTFGARRPAKKDGKAGPSALEARRDFRTCVHWAADVRTNEKGQARIEDIQFADSLTRWRFAVRVVDASTRVGSARATVRTRKVLTIDVRTPRFLRAGDRVSMPMLVGNRDAGALHVRANWWTGTAPFGTSLEQLAELATKSDAGDEPKDLAKGKTWTRDIELRTTRTGIGLARAEVTCAEAPGDKIERTFEVLPQGIEKASGTVISTIDGRGQGTVRVPEDAVPGTIEARISLEASTVQAVGAALPYLLDYPHGCTEQTMNRFGPVLEVQAAISALGIRPPARMKELPAMREAGIARLRALQRSNGGFGWWDSDQASPVMTSLVVRGLSRLLAMDKSQEAVVVMHDRAAHWLGRWWKARPKMRPQPDAATTAGVLLALVEAGAKPNAQELQALYDSNHVLADSPITRAWLLRAAHASGLTEWTKQISSALIKAAATTGDHTYWHARMDPDANPTTWREDPIEATAEVLHALLVTDSADAAILERGAAWLVANRPGGDRWRSTRDTAAAVRFLAAHAAKSQTLGIGRTITVRIDDQPVANFTTTRDNLLGGGSVITLDADLIQAGKAHTVSVTTEGASVSAAISLRWFEVGPAIRAASSGGLEITRRWYQLNTVQSSFKGVTGWRRTPLSESVMTGELVECEIVITSTTPREFVMVVDPYAAGFEPEREFGMTVEGRGPAAEAHIERYDDRTAFFVTNLPAGKTVLRHLVRATHAGVYTALPAQVELMYFPAVRANSNGEQLEVRRWRPEAGKEGR